jgi:hypothetical protein
MLPFIINGQVCLLCIWIKNPKFLIFNDASFDNFNYDSEKIHCTPIDLIEALKIMDYEYTTYFIPLNHHFHP